jgi:hypothetical protein
MPGRSFAYSVEAPVLRDLHSSFIMSNNTNDGTNSPSNSNIDNSLEAHLNSLLSNSSLDDSNGTDDLTEILARLESADGIASGVEGRLDELLETLDNLLISMETRDGETMPENERTMTIEAEQVAVIATESNPSGPAFGR